jgi:DNA-binding PadR family transcriptional regulator
MKNSLGMNEALILSAMHAGKPMSVADVAAKLREEAIGRLIDDGSIYIALHRMSKRGFVSSSKHVVTSADGKQREIGYYAVCAEGRKAVAQLAHEAQIARRLAGGVA